MHYNKRTWLNGENIPSTSNIVAFDGMCERRGNMYRNTFLSVSDCNVSARLHKSDDETMDDFINKMRILKSEVESFIEHLEKNNFKRFKR